jgi:hypothetical protein
LHYKATLQSQNTHQSGNVLFLILIAIVLIGGLSFAVSQGFSGTKGIRDTDIQSKVNTVLRYANDVKSAVTLVYSNGTSETDISFAHPTFTGYGTINTTPAAEVFNAMGGGGAIRDIPPGINNGDQIEFYGFTAAPDIGVNAEPDLMMVIPNVELEVCQAVNATLGYAADATPVTDTGSCIHNTSSRFSGSFASGGAVNDMGRTNFSVLPMPYGCVQCTGPTSYHIFYTLLER